MDATEDEEITEEDSGQPSPWKHSLFLKLREGNPFFLFLYQPKKSSIKS